MSEAKFIAGTTVRLKSGGPLMTVVSFDRYLGEERYKCRWFDDKKKLTEAVFSEAEIEPASMVGPVLRTVPLSRA